MNASEIDDSLYRLFRNQIYKLSNVYVFGSDWESDFLSVSKSNGYMTEVEIKVSRSDFFADFKKTRKHLVMGSKKQFFVIPGHVTSWTYNPDTGNVDRPHASEIEVVNVEKCAPNRFYYACADGLITQEEIPAYAGLIYVRDRGRESIPCAWIQKKAPLLHKNKHNKDSLLLDKFYYLSLDLKFRLKMAQSENKRLRESLITP